METTTKYMLGGVAVGAVVGITAIAVALYAQWQPIFDFVDAAKAKFQEIPVETQPKQ